MALCGPVDSQHLDLMGRKKCAPKTLQKTLKQSTHALPCQCSHAQHWLHNPPVLHWCMNDATGSAKTWQTFVGHLQ
jgi:hypothetical protein